VRDRYVLLVVFFIIAAAVSLKMVSQPVGSQWINGSLFPCVAGRAASLLVDPKSL